LRKVEIEYFEKEKMSNFLDGLLPNFTWADKPSTHKSVRMPQQIVVMSDKN